MVRGVNEWLNGKPEFLIAILLAGTTAWVAAAIAYFAGLPLPFRTFSADGWVVLGGLLFGLGTAFNQGCGVSTLSKLARGQLQMTSTLTGWVIGWCILAQWPIPQHPGELEPPSVITFSTLAALSLGLSLWALLGDQKRKKLWFSMMGIGLLAGLLFLYERSWPPSGFLHNLSAALLHNDNLSWPTTPQYMLLLALLGGMAFSAWRTKHFDLYIPHWHSWLIHLTAGTLMGLGASLALGGNDSQLLIALPAFSPAGALAITTMVLGIFLGLKARKVWVQPQPI